VGESEDVVKFWVYFIRNGERERAREMGKSGERESARGRAREKFDQELSCSLYKLSVNNTQNSHKISSKEPNRYR